MLGGVYLEKGTAMFVHISRAIIVSFALTNKEKHLKATDFNEF